ncbi:MAG: hypothetical protein WD404_01240 [Solirubrobacterales bacterium]
MPTKRPRHTITEVGPVEDALTLLRAEIGEPDLRELVVLGAERKLELEDERERAAARRRELRERLIARTTEPGAIDPAAAAAVRERGFSRELDG